MKSVCFVLCALLALTACASLSVPQSPLSQRAPRPPSEESLRQDDSYYDYLLAQHYVRENQVEKAIEAYNQALKKDPHSAVLLTELAALYVRQGKIEAALKLSEEAIANHPDYEQAYLLLGQLYAGSGQNKQAVATYLHLLEMNSKNADVYLLLGTLYAQDGRFTEAMETFDQLQRLFPGNPMALYYKARILLDMKSYDQSGSGLSGDPCFRTDFRECPSRSGLYL